MSHNKKKKILHTTDSKSLGICVNGNNDTNNTMRSNLNKLFKTKKTNGCIMCHVPQYKLALYLGGETKPHSLLSKIVIIYNTK